MQRFNVDFNFYTVANILHIFEVIWFVFHLYCVYIYDGDFNCVYVYVISQVLVQLPGEMYTLKCI